MLNAFFALDRIPDVIVSFDVNKLFQTVTLCKTVYQALTMFECAPRQVTRDAGIQNAIASISYEINPAAPLHPAI
jgi:hypothetical protein